MARTPSSALFDKAPIGPKPSRIDRSLSTRSPLYIPMGYDPEIGEDAPSAQCTPSNSFDHLPALRSTQSLGKVGLGRRTSLESLQSQGEPLLGSKVSPEEGQEALLRSISAQERRFRRALAFVLLWKSGTVASALGSVLGFFCIMAVPLAEYIWLRPVKESEEELPFRGLVLSLETSLAVVSYAFLTHLVSKHGVRKLLLLEVLLVEDASVQEAYIEHLQDALTVLGRLFLPAFALHVSQKLWWWLTVPHAPLPVTLGHTHVIEVLFILLTSYSWVFRTVCFLYVCVLFWGICGLQVLKMRYYSQLLDLAADPSWCFHEYVRLCQGLVTISHRFRAFLAWSGVLILFGLLASMYNVVREKSDSLTFLNSGDLIVCNWVYVNGGFICLQAASKIAHFHRRIVKLASSMHAERSCDFGFRMASSPAGLSSPGGLEELAEEGGGESQTAKMLQAWIRRADAYQQRAALVNYLTHSTAGISVYGFVLDRFFVHTSFGALCTTTWFILGRSLGAA
ncbi:hypothetical protein KFL_005580010 [Klebsormidium nitens]|uniref:Uncharacterized protein n=1 Tax=Klebsormidium nitens TaxID=105231 RepID=A0A0U9HKN1_KLENI|nr:hypothetical protein KFL_005580010 [Klebsormidium nitens]|eukprot:GAQ89749.1 hypothetical protein KFL_005580010 [Klebsormidium nitens]